MTSPSENRCSGRIGNKNGNGAGQRRDNGAAIPSRREYNRLYGLDLARHARMKEGAIVCHPGPMNRGMEIMPEVADAPNSKILNQVNAGVCTRMAAMYLLLGGDDNDVA